MFLYPSALLKEWHSDWDFILLITFQQQDKSKLIEETMEKQEEWRNKSEALLYSMIPRTIAERLKRGEDPVKTCEVRAHTLPLKSTGYIRLIQTNLLFLLSCI